MAFLPADSGGDLGPGEHRGKAVDGEVTGPPPSEALHGVVGDEIDLGVKPPRVPGEDGGLLEGVVDVLDEDVLEGHHLALLRLVFDTGVEELGEGILAIDRHDLLADFVSGAVKRKGEPDLQRLLREKPDLRRKSAGGNGNFARADANTPRCVDDVERGQEIGVVGQRFAHTHEDEIVDAGLVAARSRKSARRSRRP